MKHYHYFFLLLKLSVLVQFVLILANKESVDSKVYILTEIIFKTALFIFIEIFLFHKIIDGLAFEDKLIISFAGGLLFYDAWFNDFPKFMKLYYKKINISIHK